MMKRNVVCWCGSGQKWKKCHYPDPGPEQEDPATLAKRYKKQYQILLKDEKTIQGMRRAGALVAEILTTVSQYARAGITTKELNDFAHRLHEEAGATPASLNYGHPPFPGSICTSLNDVICHGIPDNTILQDGDILNIDVALILNGFYGDNSMMVCIGEVDQEKQRVVDTAYQCLMDAIAILKPGTMIYEIGDAIEKRAAQNACSVVNQFVGHGVGTSFHENPQIPHHKNTVAIPLAPGMTFTIEPMINAGVVEAVIDPNDQWTARTADGRASAQWEHTLLITEDSYEILTPWKRLPHS